MIEADSLNWIIGKIIQLGGSGISLVDLLCNLYSFKKGGEEYDGY